MLRLGRRFGVRGGSRGAFMVLPQGLCTLSCLNFTRILAEREVGTVIPISELLNGDKATCPGGHGHRAAELSFKPSCKDFPGGPVVKSPPANAGDVGSILGWGRFHRTQLLKPVHPRACASQQENPPQEQAFAPQLPSSPHSPQLEKSLRSSENPVQPK